jgi:hypothetical protein
MYVEWGWEQRAIEAQGRLTRAVADGAAAEVYRAVLERLVTGTSFGAVYRSILNRLSAEARSLLADSLRARGSELLDIEGRAAGFLSAVFVERESGRPQWLAVSHQRDGRERIVGVPASALAGVGVGIADVSVVLEEIRSAPLLDMEYMSAHNERELCKHYGLQPSPTAAAGRVERRATCSQAFPPLVRGGPVRWLPGPRER